VLLLLLLQMLLLLALTLALGTNLQHDMFQKMDATHWHSQQLLRLPR